MVSSSAELCGIFDRKSDLKVGPFFIGSPSNGVMMHERSDVHDQSCLWTYFKKLSEPH